MPGPTNKEQAQNAYTKIVRPLPMLLSRKKKIMPLSPLPRPFVRSDSFKVNKVLQALPKSWRKKFQKNFAKFFQNSELAVIDETPKDASLDWSRDAPSEAATTNAKVERSPSRNNIQPSDDDSEKSNGDFKSQWRKSDDEQGSESEGQNESEPTEQVTHECAEVSLTKRKRGQQNYTSEFDRDSVLLQASWSVVLDDEEMNANNQESESDSHEYDSQNEPEPSEQRIHECAEMPGKKRNGGNQVSKPEFDRDSPLFQVSRNGGLDDEETHVNNEMRIRTMYKMVEDVHVIWSGSSVTKKLLYLTNKQASMFDESSMNQCIEALELGSPKFVIILLRSTGLESAMTPANRNDCKSSELCAEDEKVVKTQILLFIRTCILPLAMQTRPVTRAIIVVSGVNDCLLSSALSDVVHEEQARLGKDCPFTVIATVNEQDVHLKAFEKQDREEFRQLAGKIARGSKEWRKRMIKMNDCREATLVHFESEYKGRSDSDGMKFINGFFSKELDLTAAASHYVVIENFDNFDVVSNPASSIGKEESEKNNSTPMVDWDFETKKRFDSLFLQCLTRKLPSIAIQTHEIADKVAHLAALSGRNIPVLLLDSTERAMSMTVCPSEPATTLARESNAFPKIRSSDLLLIDGELLEFQSRLKILDIAEEMIVRKYACLMKKNIRDVLDCSTLAFLHCALRIGAERHASANMTLHERIKHLDEKRNNLNKGADLLKIHSDLAARAISTLDKTLYRDSTANQMGQDEWVAYYSVLTSPNTFAGSIHDLKGLQKTLASVTTIDRLPAQNSLEALRTIQEAWDYSEIYEQVADRYKIISKITYVMSLVVGILITTFSLIESNFGYSSKIYILALSSIGTAVAAYVTFMNPVARWQKLRMASLSIVSEVWLFRTRAGIYRFGKELDYKADYLFKENIRAIKSTLFEGSDIKSTAFFQRASSRNQHKQHNDMTVFGTFDEQAPVNSEPARKSKWLTLPFLSSKSKTSLERHVSPADLKKAPTPFCQTDHWKKYVKRDLAQTCSPKPDPAVLPVEKMESALNGDCKIVSGYESGTYEKYGGTDQGEVDLADIIKFLRRGKISSDQSDDHYSPAQPEKYIRFRVMKAMKFYQDRIPKCSRTRNVAQGILLLGSISAGILAFANLAVWAAGVSIFTSAVTAFLEFQGTNDKIVRYSFTVHALQEVVFWWQTLPQIDQSLPASIDQLILTCEDLLQREQHAWMSTSQAVRMLQRLEHDPTLQARVKS